MHGRAVFTSHSIVQRCAVGYSGRLCSDSSSVLLIAILVPTVTLIVAFTVFTIVLVVYYRVRLHQLKGYKRSPHDNMAMESANGYHGDLKQLYFTEDKTPGYHDQGTLKNSTLGLRFSKEINIRRIAICVVLLTSLYGITESQVEVCFQQNDMGENCTCSSHPPMLPTSPSFCLSVPPCSTTPSPTTTLTPSTDTNILTLSTDTTTLTPSTDTILTLSTDTNILTLSTDTTTLTPSTDTILTPSTDTTILTPSTTISAPSTVTILTPSTDTTISSPSTDTSTPTTDTTTDTTTFIPTTDTTILTPSTDTIITRTTDTFILTPSTDTTILIPSTGTTTLTSSTDATFTISSPTPFTATTTTTSAPTSQSEPTSTSTSSPTSSSPSSPTGKNLDTICSSSPCENDAECTVDYNNLNFTCSCAVWYSGRLCSDSSRVLLIAVFVPIFILIVAFTIFIIVLLLYCRARLHHYKMGMKNKNSYHDVMQQLFFTEDKTPGYHDQGTWKNSILGLRFSKEINAHMRERSQQMERQAQHPFAVYNGPADRHRRQTDHVRNGRGLSNGQVTGAQALQTFHPNGIHSRDIAYPDHMVVSSNAESKYNRKTPRYSSRGNYRN